MISYKLSLLALLATQTLALEFHTIHSTSVKDKNKNQKEAGKMTRNSNNNQRELGYRSSKSGKSGKSGKSRRRRKEILMAEIAPKGPSDFDEVEGWVSMIFDDDKFDISYDLEGLPESCKDDECYFAVKKGSCDNLKSGKYHKDDYEVWSKDDAGFTTSRGGQAAGSIYGLKSGYDYGKNECRSFMVLGLVEGSKSSDDDKIRRLGCGPLVPKGNDEDFCSSSSSR